MEHVDDWYIIEKVLGGETQAYAVLVNKYKDMAYSIAWKIIRNREDAEEIAQDAFISAFKSLDRFRQRSKFSTWLYRIIYNTAISRVRKKQTELLPIDESLTEDYTQDQIIEDIDTLTADERRELINKALDRLPVEDNTLITLFYMEDCSVHEISQITGLTKVNVKVRLHRIRKRLCHELQNQLQMITTG